jgi:EpsI family protein
MSQVGRVLVSLAILVSALLILHRSNGDAVPIRKPLDSFPTTVGEWQAGRGTIFSADILSQLMLRDYVMRDYGDERGRNVNLYIAYWDTQRKGAAMHSPKNCLPTAGWEPVEASVVTIPLSPPHSPITVNRYLIQKDRDQQVVLYWYHAQGRVIAGEVSARIEMVKSAVVKNRTDGALVRVISPVYGSVRETSDRLVAYVQELYPILAEYLPD